MIRSKFWRDFTGQIQPDLSFQAANKRRAARKGKAWRLGHAGGVLCRAYLKGESKASKWAESRGLPVILSRGVSLTCRLALMALVIYASYYVAFAVFGFWLLRRFLVRDPIPVYVVNNEGYDSEALFPDPDSAEYMNDPAFDHDD